MNSGDERTIGAPGAGGRALGHFQLLRLLGHGGMGEVYLAHDPKLDRPVALKLLPSMYSTDEERRWRFETGARAAAALNHPNIMTMFEFGDCDGQYFFAAEYVEGETLSARLRRGPISVAEALRGAIQIASAVAASHAAGIAHRDLKPANIMIRPDGVVKVLDFGLARMSAGEEHTVNGRTVAGSVLGTVPYMSPE